MSTLRGQAMTFVFDLVGGELKAKDCVFQVEHLGASASNERALGRAHFGFVIDGVPHVLGSGEAGRKRLEEFILESRRSFADAWRSYQRIHPKRAARRSGQFSLYRTKLRGLAKTHEPRAWARKKGYKLSPLRLLAGQRYRVRIDTPTVYQTIAREDEAFVKQAKGLFPFRSAAHKGETFRVQRGQHRLSLSLQGYTALCFQLFNLEGLHRATLDYKKKIAPHVQSLQVAQEGRRVFAQAPASAARETALAACQRVRDDTQAALKAAAAEELKEIERWGRGVYALFKPDSKGQAEWDRHYQALWHEHEGRFGPYFLLLVSLLRLRETTLEEEVWKGFVRNRLLLDPKKHAKHYQAPLEVAGESYWKLDARPSFSKADSALMVQRSLSVTVDLLCAFNTRFFATFVTETAQGLTRAGVSLEPAKALFKHLGGDMNPATMTQAAQESIKALVGQAERSQLLRHLEKVDPSPRLLGLRQVLDPKFQASANAVDDVFATLDKIAQQSSQLPKEVVEGAPFRKVLSEVGKEFGNQWGRKLREVAANVGEKLRFVASGFVLIFVGCSLAESTQKPDGRWGRMGLEFVGAICGLGADWACVSSQLKNSTAGSRAIGASRIWGALAALITLIAAIWDYFAAKAKNDVRKQSQNLIIAIGAAICLFGFFWDGTILGAPVGIVLNILGTVVIIAGALYDYLWPPSEARVYLKRLYAWSKQLAVIQGQPGQVAFERAILGAAPGEVPADAFVVAPKVRLRATQPADKRSWGGKLEVQVESFRASGYQGQVTCGVPGRPQQGPQSFALKLDGERVELKLDTGAALRESKGDLPAEIELQARASGPSQPAQIETSHRVRLRRPSEVVQLSGGHFALASAPAKPLQQHTYMAKAARSTPTSALVLAIKCPGLAKLSEAEGYLTLELSLWESDGPVGSEYVEERLATRKLSGWKQAQVSGDLVLWPLDADLLTKLTRGAAEQEGALSLGFDVKANAVVADGHGRESLGSTRSSRLTLTKT